MNIRPYRPTDLSALLAIHDRQCEHDGVGYLFNHPADPRTFATVVAVEDGWIVGAAMGRKICEGSTVLNHRFGGDGKQGPVRRWQLLAQLIKHSARVAFDNGYTEMMAATPPNSRGYTARLVRELGFQVDDRNRLMMDLNSRFNGGRV